MTRLAAHWRAGAGLLVLLWPHTASGTLPHSLSVLRLKPGRPQGLTQHEPASEPEAANPGPELLLVPLPVALAA
jgi:hypothetical protein